MTLYYFEGDDEFTDNFFADLPIKGELKELIENIRDHLATEFNSSFEQFIEASEAQPEDFQELLEGTLDPLDWVNDIYGELHRQSVSSMFLDTQRRSL